jgi:hypothetical protein
MRFDRLITPPIFSARLQKNSFVMIGLAQSRLIRG